MQSTSTRCQLLDLSFVQNKDANNFLSNLFSRHKLELENALETCLEVSGEFFRWTFIRFRKLKNWKRRNRHFHYKFIEELDENSLKELQLHRKRAKNQFQALYLIQAGYSTPPVGLAEYFHEKWMHISWPRMQSSIFVPLSQMNSRDFSVCCAVSHSADLWRSCLRFHKQKINPL